MVFPSYLGCPCRMSPPELESEWKTWLFLRISEVLVLEELCEEALGCYLRTEGVPWWGVCMYWVPESEWVEGKWGAKGAPGNPCGLTGCPLRVLGLVQRAGLAGSEAHSEEAETAEDAMQDIPPFSWLRWLSLVLEMQPRLEPGPHLPCCWVMSYWWHWNQMLDRHPQGCRLVSEII